MFLVMGFSGERAAQVKEAFIAEFNRMEEALRSRRLTVRERGKQVRNTFTATLRGHGVTKPPEYAQVTNSTYRALYDADASSLRKRHGLPERANVREHMSEIGLASVMLSEAMASDRIVATNRYGVDQCSDAAHQCATRVRAAIAQEKASRKVIGAPE
jgi:hypothetical protein